MKNLISRLMASHPVRAWKHYSDHRGNLLAGGITYVALFSVVSTLVVGFTVLGTVMSRRGELRDRVIASVDEQLPGLLDVGADGGLVAPEDLFRTDVVSVAGIVGLLVALVFGLGWLDAVRQGIRAVFGCEIDKTFIVRKKLKDAGVLATLGALVLLSASVGLLVSSATGWLLRLVGLQESVVGTGLLRAAGVLVVLAVDAVILMVLFRLLSGLDLPWRTLRSGALVGAVALGVLKLFAGLLLGTLGGSNPLLAGSAVLAGLIVWVNLMARVTLLSAAWAATTAADEGFIRPAPTLVANEPPAPHPTAIGPRDVTLPSFGRRASDRTTIAAGAVLGALAVTGVRVLGGAVRSLREGVRSSSD